VTDDELKIDLQGAVAVVSINRPQRRNALGDALVGSLQATLRRHDEDAEIAATILTGVAPGFCAGSDLKELGTMSLDDMCAHEARTAFFCREISALRKPVIAAVEGFALGGGFILAASCDVVVSGRNVRWNLPEVEIGWTPPWGLETLVNRVGLTRARQLTWGGQTFGGEEAVRLGVADHVVDDGQAIKAALTIGSRLAKLPSMAVASTKLYFATQAARDSQGGDLLASRLFRDDCRSPVAQATLQKFGVKA
jgi:enoyl-CoA hydratase/carnithine racemase